MTTMTAPETTPPRSERAQAATIYARIALTLLVAYGDRAEAMAHEYAEDDPSYKRVALLIREAMR